MGPIETIQLSECAMHDRPETLGYILIAQSWHKTTSSSSVAAKIQHSKQTPSADSQGR